MTTPNGLFLIKEIKRTKCILKDCILWPWPLIKKLASRSLPRLVDVVWTLNDLYMYLWTKKLVQGYCKQHSLCVKYEPEKTKRRENGTNRILQKSARTFTLKLGSRLLHMCVWSMRQIGPSGEKICSGQGFYKKFCYDLDHRPRYLVQGHCKL